MADKNTRMKEGAVRFHHPSLPHSTLCQTWYRIYGDLKSSKSGRPLVTLHGGPGACHNYLLNLQALSTNHGIPVVFYDQLGNGNSTHLREKRLDTKFWTPELFMAEMENLLEHLGIVDDYDLLAKSHRGLKRSIISNSPASMSLWVDACNEWRKLLPRDVNETLEKHEKDKTYDDPEYKDAVMYFYKLHMCRVSGEGSAPFPKDVMDSLEQLEKDDTVYFTMNGPSEFTVVGSLKTWSSIDRLQKISVPTLVLNAEFDEARDSCVYPFFSSIPKAKWYTFPGASHMSNVEKPELYISVVREFLMQ